MTEMKRLTCMRLNFNSPSRSGFTLPELMISMSVMTVISLIAFSFLRSGTILTAKATRMNYSHDELRGSFDRMADQLMAANNVATLLGTDGLPVAGSGPAAGIKFDKVIGDPYILDPAATAGSFTATATTLSIWRSTNADVTAPLPSVGDVLLIPTSTGNIRARITATVPGGIAAERQKIALTFSAAVGKALSWGANQPQVVKIVRPEAFIVMPVPLTGTNELRFFPQFEPVPTLSDKTKYKVLTNQVGTASGEGTPFSILTIDGDRMVQSTLRVRETQYSKALTRQEINNYSGYFQLLLNLPSRLRPKTTN